MADQHRDSAAQFARDTANHEMTVLHKDGLYRHLRFRHPDRSEYWFELVTWPGALAISGDMGGYTFRRLDDMFAFFRQSASHGINPHYWSEKLDGGRDSAKAYDEDLFKRRVAEDLAEAEEDCPGVTAAWNEKVAGIVPDYYTATEEEARRALEDFTFNLLFRASCTCGDAYEVPDEDSAVTWKIMGHSGKGHTASIRQADGFRFYDAWEWDLRDYTYQFLWCCHAIVWGIAQYDRRAAEAVAT
jgi:hypothetical protein